MAPNTVYVLIECPLTYDKTETHKRMILARAFIHTCWRLASISASFSFRRCSYCRRSSDLNSVRRCESIGLTGSRSLQAGSDVLILVKNSPQFFLQFGNFSISVSAQQMEIIGNRNDSNLNSFLQVTKTVSYSFRQ